MQRLTEKQSAGYDLIDMKGLWCDLYCNEQSIYTCKDCAIDKAIQKLADYEDLEEQGLMIKLPCKVGDTVYEVQELRGHIQLYEVTSISISKNNILFWWEIKDGGIYSNTTGFTVYAIGKTVFFTKEEAEAKLREMEGENE